MFKLSFTKKDVVRAAWAFGVAFLVALGASANGVHDLSTAQAAVVAAVVAGVLAVKNLVLADGSALKG